MGLRKYKLGELIEQCNTRNIEETYTLDDVKGGKGGRIRIHIHTGIEHTK